MKTLSLSLLALVALLAAACGRTAELIPGTATAIPTPTPTPTLTPTPIVAPTAIVPPTHIGVTGAPAAGETDSIPDAIFPQSVVQIVALDAGSGVERAVRRGSGVIVDGERALILTSYPLVDPFLSDGSPAYTTLAVGLSAEAGDPAVLLYEAEIVTAAPDHDLAVLRAVSAYREAPLVAGEFSAPAVRLGNSATIETREKLRLFGYAGEGERAAATGAHATLLGTRSASGVDGRAWLDMDARLPAGMDGGGVFSQAGGLVGVLVQLRHDEAVSIGTARPAALAEPLIEAARSAEPRASYHALLQHPRPARNSPDPAASGVAIRGPAFAENALAGGGRTSLFDYTRFPVGGLPALYYEFAAQGIPDGTLVEERWFLEDVLQDALSSAYTWTEGDFAVVTDRLLAPNPNGVPAGQWRLEVWVDESLAATGLAYIGIEPPETTIGELTFGSTVGADGDPGSPPAGSASRLFGFFEYEGAGGVLWLHWVVFHDGDVVYESPPSLWLGGDSGRWWVGHHADGPLGEGSWEFEIYFDAKRAGAGGTELQ